MSHAELVEMLDEDGAVLDDVIELSDEDDAPPAAAPAGAAPKATLVSGGRQAEAGRAGPDVEIVGLQPLPRMPSAPSRASELAADEEAIAASELQIAELREALSLREMELNALRDELLDRERELTLLRSLRPPPPSRRLVDRASLAPSSAGTARARFLAEGLERTLEGWRTAGDFLRHFPPGIVVKRLDRHPAVRATYLRLLVGIPERTALRTATEDAGRLLQTAVDAGDCEPDSYVQLFQRTVTSNYLDPATIWSFMIDEELLEIAWQTGAARHAAAQRHVARLLDTGLAHGLIDPTAAVEGISVEVFADALPDDRLSALLRSMLDGGRAGRPFTEADLLAAIPSDVLVGHVPLPYVVEGVLIPMSRAAGLSTSLPPQA